MELKIAVCDDNPADAKMLSALAERWSAENEHSALLRLFPSAESFLFEFEENKNFDVLLLDVEMGRMNGVELARELRRQKSNAEIIFITTHTEFYGEGYEVDALHYLIKPVSQNKLFEVLDKAVFKLASAEPPLLISTGGETVRLEKKDVLYAEAFLHYISVYTQESEYRLKESMGDFENRLGSGFFRCHRSYIVSLSQITKITRSSVTLSNGKELPLSRGKYDEINRAYIRAFS